MMYDDNCTKSPDNRWYCEGHYKNKACGAFMNEGDPRTVYWMGNYWTTSNGKIKPPDNESEIWDD